MPMTNMMIEFKKKRPSFKKEQMNVSVSSARMQNIDRALSEKSQFYELLNRSEKLDLMLFTLEWFMSNSESYNLEMVGPDK